MIYCSKCKKTEGRFVKFARAKLSSGKYKQYYYCNNCNTNRVKSYRTTPSGKEAISRAIKKYRDKNPERVDAWLASKELESKPCEECSVVNTHRHHPNVKNKLEVVYLCAYHHRQAHLK